MQMNDSEHPDHEPGDELIDQGEVEELVELSPEVEEERSRLGPRHDDVANWLRKNHIPEIDASTMLLLFGLLEDLQKAVDRPPDVERYRQAVLFVEEVERRRRGTRACEESMRRLGWHDS